MSAYPARVEALFHAALERPTRERATFVCLEAGDEALSAEVLSLLEHVRAEGPAASAGDAEGDEPALPEGTLVGRYRIVGPVGRGGMGQVYRARPRDAAPDAPDVALKVLPRGGRDGACLARFEREGRVLAHLAHPGIAAFVEAGTDPLHGPFVAMEFVDGRRLLQHCDWLGLGLSARLELYARVCDAVQAAHARGVVHRDIKPDNVLVTPEGHPKLVDFGIAKPDCPRVSGATATRTGQPAPLTPRYASPEQLSGHAVTAASDVFALGLLLAELVAGATPPSDASPRAQRARREVEALVAAATRFDPADRPGSAAALARDARRVAAGRRAPLRLTRETRRRRWHYALGAAAAAVSALALAAAALRPQPPAPAPVALEPWVAETDEQLQQAGATLEVRALTLQGFAQRLTRIFDDSRTSGELRLALASSHERLASVEGHPRRSNLGRPDSAALHYRRAVKLRAEAARTASDTHALGALADALTAYGTLRLDTFHDLTEAHGSLTEALALAHELRAGEASSAAALSLARVRLRLADLELRQGRRAEALRQVEAVPAAAQGLREPPGLDLRYKLSGALARRGQLAASWGDPAAAVAHLQRHTLEMQALDAEDVRDEEALPSVFQVDLADALGNPNTPNLGRVDEALAVYRASRAAYAAHLRREADDALVRHHLRVLRLHEAQTLGRRAPRAALDAARALVAELDAGSGDRGACMTGLAAAHSLAAVSLRALGATPAAYDEARRALELLTRLERHPDDHPVLASRAGALELLGDLEARLGRRAAARTALERARELAAHLWSHDPSPASGLRLARVSTVLAELEAAPRGSRARDKLRAALDLLRALPGPCSGSTRNEREQLERRLVDALARA